jgi:phosphatidyl-myo-inositol dimannoside synthase
MGRSHNRNDLSCPFCYARRFRFPKVTVQESKQLAKRIIGLFPDLLGIGGIQEAGRLTAAALDGIAFRRGWNTSFLSLNDSPGPRELETGQGTIPFQGFGRVKVRFLLASVGAVQPLAPKNVSIVLAAHPNLAVVSGWMRRISPRLQTIVMAHGVEVWKPLASLRRRALVEAQLVLAPSGDTAQKLIEVQGVSPKKIRKLPWPISPSFLRMADAPGGPSLPRAFPKRARVILTVGRWSASERYKGADELIRAVSQLVTIIPDLHLVAVGGGDDLPRLQRLAADLIIADRVHFLENLSREEVGACYAHADVFALPSTGEGFGLVFLEAMAFSKPVVGAASGGTTDVVEDGVNGLLVPPNNAGALVQALGRLLCDESLREELGRRGGEIVRRRFQFADFESQLERILDESDSRHGEMRIARDVL